jgi:hypothetical protein
VDLSTVTVESFSPLVGGMLMSGNIPLMLIEASVLSAPAHVAGGRQPFRLQFAGPAPMLPQAIYPLTLPSGEVLELFLVPIGAVQNDEFLYEAIFH